MRRFRIYYDWMWSGCLPIFDMPEGSYQFRPHSNSWDLVKGDRACLESSDYLTQQKALAYVKDAARLLPDDEGNLFASLRSLRGFRNPEEFTVALGFVPAARNDRFKDWEPDNPPNFPQQYLYF